MVLNSVRMNAQKGESMKLKGILVLLVLIVLSSCRSVVAPEFDLNPVVKNETSNDLKYEELKDESELVVRVKVLDKLTLANSVVRTKYSFYSLRNVEILDVYHIKEETDKEVTNKEETVQVEDVIEIKEAAAIDASNVYYTSNHMPLVENGEYVLFLDKNDNGDYVILDGDNGVVNVDNIINNQNIEVMVNVLFEYFKPVINNVEIDYVPLTLVEQPKNVKYERITVKTKQVDIPLRIGQQTSTNQEYITIGNIYFELEEPILEKIK